MPTRLIIADDDIFACKALETMLKAEGFEILGLAHNGYEAEALVDQTPPDLLLMDIRMPKRSGLEAAAPILNKHPDLKILLLTTFKDQEYISKALALGCRGYLLKQNFSALVPSLEAILAGSMVFDSDIVKGMAVLPTKEGDSQLKDSEQELLTLIAQGLSNKEIAQTLFLSEGTIRNKISSLLEHLDLRDRTQLAIHYYRRLLEEQQSKG